MFYFVLDFISQTESGLKLDIKMSGVKNIDPWEDMKEDANNIENYFLSKLNVKILGKSYLKIKTKYIIRFIIEYKDNLISFLKANKEIILNYIQNGMSSTVLRGIPFKIIEVNQNKIQKLLVSSLPLNNFINNDSKIYSYRHRNNR